MGIGSDIKAVLQSIGMSFTIIRPSGNLTGEFLDLDPTRKTNNAFYSEHSYDATLSYDTQVDHGDLLQTADGRLFYAMSVDPDTYQSGIYSYTARLYKCNAVVTIDRQGTGSYGAQQHPFTPVASNLNCVLTMADFSARNDLNADPVAGLATYAYVAWWPLSVQIKRGDRVSVAGVSHGLDVGGATTLKITEIDDYTYHGMSAIALTKM